MSAGLGATRPALALALALVQAAACGGEAKTPEVAAKAFRDDPEPRVRGVAIMALSRSAKPEVFRESFQLALKDPAFRRSFLSGALSNYASRNDAESVAGMVEALLKDPSLSDNDRKELEALR